MNDTYDLAIVGGGVLGTFHAYFALQKGLRVVLFEKNTRPMKATVRNFGQVVPSGMNSKWQTYGRKSLETYKKIQAEFDISLRENGTVYLASNEEEENLLVELHEINQGNQYRSMLLNKRSCLDSYPGLNPNYVRSGLFFPEEVTVEPRTMIHKLHDYLKVMGLDLFFDTEILECNSLLENVKLHSAKNETFTAAKVIVCNGSDFKTLYPRLFGESDLEVSKLQMMQTKPQTNYNLKGSILTGLTIRRYDAFTECPSYSDLKKGANSEWDNLVEKWGIHILFKQAIDGSVILGDSHEYANIDNSDKLGFDINMDIDNFILQESKKIFSLPTYEIQSRWVGFYSQCKNSDIYQHDVDNGVQIVTGIGGKGMTGSAGFAKENIDQIFNFQNA